MNELKDISELAK